jgi:uncharacterized protein with PIN domain
MAITLYFHGDLSSLLRRKWRDNKRVAIAVERTASIKDVVESFGLPHTEVGRLQVDDIEIEFNHLIASPCRIDIWPVTTPWNVLAPSVLRPEPLSKIHFLVDANVSKLARLLRMAGFDATTNLHLEDEALAVYAKKERRILLSKDRGLLMRKNVEFGRIIRAIEPLAQYNEIINLLALHGQMHPFSRCLLCNCPLKPVAKEQIIHLLEPLTKRYYNDFSQCPDCEKLYWPGSHVKKMLPLLTVGQDYD